jgi:hypothetical protein
MEAVNPPSDNGASLFNSPLETGIRALTVLEAFYPRRFDLTEMTWFDHLVVHTSDLSDFAGTLAPDSLHPDLPARAGELFVRRRLVESSLRLVHRAHLVDILHDENGVQFVASEEAPSFLASLKAPYTLELRKRAVWLAEQFRDLRSAEIAELVRKKVGRWTADFAADSAPGQIGP